jgi:hypothetical protein
VSPASQCAPCLKRVVTVKVPIDNRVNVNESTTQASLSPMVLNDVVIISEGRHTAQAFSRWLPTAAARVPSQVSSC